MAGALTPAVATAWLSCSAWCFPATTSTEWSTGSELLDNSGLRERTGLKSKFQLSGLSVCPQHHPWGF